MLKIAGVKSEKEFYKKYPSEEAFMKAHGKEFKKAAMGAKMVKTQLNQLTDFGNPPQAQVGTQLTGVTATDYNFLDPNTPITAAGPNFLGQQPAYSGLTGLDLTAAENKIDISKQTGYKQGAKPISGMMGGMGGMGGMNLISGVIGGIQEIGKLKKQKKEAQSLLDVSKVVNRAAGTRDIDPIKRKYSRPEDVVVNPEQLFPSYGTGYNPGFAARNGSVIRAQGGMQIGGNATEIQNTYAPTNTLYDDLGYEPLNNSNQLKQYDSGGPVDMSSATENYGAGDSLSGFISGVGGSKSPVEAVANFALFAVKDHLKSGIAGRMRDTRKMNENTALMASGQGLRSQYSAYVEDGGIIPQHEEGGWVSHDWQPQVIAKFGEHSMKDLLRADPMMDTLRTGGRITQNNIYPQDQYALGGSLKTTWGGYAEPISQNPYDESETVMFRGKSHAEGDGNGHTGIGVKYGEGQHDSYTDYAEYGTEQADADVEVERGEPATEMLDPQTGEKNMVVFGNLKIPNAFVDLLGDPKAKNKKFKNYVNTLAKVEDKQNKKIDKASREIDELDVYTPFDKLKLDSLKATMMGANLTLKEASDKKKKASGLQNAINDTAAELGVDADALAKGKIKIDKEAMKEQAKYGKMIKKYQNSGTPIQITDDGNFIGPVPDDYLENLYELAKKQKRGPAVELFQKEFHRFYPSEAKDIILDNPNVTSKGKKSGIKTHKDLENANIDTILNTNVDNIFGDRTVQYHAKLQDLKKPPYIKKTPIPKIPTATTTAKKKDAIIPVLPKKRNKVMDFVNQLLPFIRPSDQEALDPRQLTGEMYALSNNQEEAVKAQGYQPQLLTPYDISLQDQLNEVTAQSRAAERMAGNNPAAAMAIAAQADQARSKILGEQMRINQGQRMGVYNKNIDTINDAKLKNLGIYDQQYVRQSQAKSNTKAVTQAALNSISDKYAKHEYENRTLGVYENLYNYRYDKSGRAINMNPLQQFGATVGESSGSGTMPNAPEGYEWDPTPRLKKKKEDESSGKNGAKIKSRNGSIVRAIKNL